MNVSGLGRRIGPIALLTLVLGLVASCGLPARAGSSTNLAQVSSTVTREFDVGTAPELIVSSQVGAVSIHTGDAGKVSVEAIKRARNQNALDRIEVTLAQEGNVIRLEYGLPQGMGSVSSGEPTVEFRVTVPATTKATLTTETGAIEVLGLTSGVSREDDDRRDLDSERQGSSGADGDDRRDRRRERGWNRTGDDCHRPHRGRRHPGRRELGSGDDRGRVGEGAGLGQPQSDREGHGCSKRLRTRGPGRSAEREHRRGYRRHARGGDDHRARAGEQAVASRARGNAPNSLQLASRAAGAETVGKTRARWLAAAGGARRGDTGLEATCALGQPQVARVSPATLDLSGAWRAVRARRRTRGG